MLIQKNSPLHSSPADGIAKVLFPYKGIKCADVNWSLQIEKSEILRFVFTANLRCSIKALTSLTPHLFWGDRERIRPGRGTISHAEEIPPEISVILLNWNKSLFSFWWDVRLWDIENISLAGPGRTCKVLFEKFLSTTNKGRCLACLAGLVPTNTSF